MKDGLNDINVVSNLFAKVNGLSNDNCFLIVLNRDYNTMDSTSIMKTNAKIAGFKNGGVAGGLIGGAIASSAADSIQKTISEFQSKLNDKEKILFANNAYYGGFLVNITPNGLGVIPLTNSNKLIPNVKNFQPDLNNYVYFDNSEIETIKIEKLPLHFSSKRLAVYFKNLDNVCTQWTLLKKHKLIPYQKDNYNKLENIIR